MILAAAVSRALGRPPSDDELASLDKYLKLLIKWSATQRLVSRSDPEWIAESLIADSLLFLRAIPADARTLVDIGSGAGFPGIPIKIVREQLSVTLLEARQRRVSFLRTAVRELQLSGAEVVAGRLEALPAAYCAAFDVAVLRCVGHLERLLPLAFPFLTAGGVVVASGPPVSKADNDPTRTRAHRPGIGDVASGINIERVVVSTAHGSTRQLLIARKP